MMGAGKLRERVTFEAPVEMRDGRGGTYQGWEPQLTVWAAYKRLRGGETVQASRLQGRQPTVITVRASKDSRRIATDWRAVDSRTGEVFAVRTVTPTDDRAWVEILTESGAPA